MDTHTTGQAGSLTPASSEILDGLNDLLQLDHDAIGAYEIAIEKLQDRDNAQQIAGFKRDHERHIQELNLAIARLGGTPRNEPHATGPFKQALQSLGGLAGDRGLLIAWRTNELQVRTKYDSYASRANHWGPDLKRLVDRNALDEERHYEWVTRALEAMGVGTAEGAEEGGGTGPLAGLRERAADVAGTARDRVADVAGTAREKVADVAGSARERVGEVAGGARDRVGAVPGQVREGVAGGLESVANRISHLVNTEEGGRMAGVAGGFAGGMESTARYVREGNVEELRRDFEGQVRRSPVQTLLAAALAGFVIGRILR
ncbi:MAG TPA: ferritin-like domain-containing protein [Longimicrobiaceae bacterium]|nr:ferritin-like domain-containing protein [Longimicrobiaceae bacterium]